MELKQLNEADSKNYQKYRLWLEQIAHAKARLEDRNIKRLQLANTIRKQREALKVLYKEEADLVGEIEQIREALINVLPSKF